MSNSNELYKRQMIWAQYRAGNNNEQAYLNLTEKFGLGSVSQKVIDDLYRRFKSGNISLFDKGTPQHGIPQAIQTLPNGEEKNFAESIFLTSNEHKLTSKMATVDGRFAIFSSYGSDGNTKIVFADLFHGKIKKVKITPRAYYGQIYSLNMIGQNHLLIETSHGFSLLKVNYETWEVSFVSRPNPGIRWSYNVIVDKLDPCKVLIQGSARFVIGNLIGDEIVFSAHQEFNFVNFYCAKLVGDCLCGLRFISRNENSWMWQYYKIDLATLTDETINTSLTFNKSFLFSICTLSYHPRSGQRLYVVFYIGNGQKRIFVFSTETSTWKDTGIVVHGKILSLFVDKNDILTVQTVDICSNKSTFYRFALKKPDSLKNLAWLTIRRSAVLFNSNLYNRIRPRLPYGRGLRCLFISDFE